MRFAADRMRFATDCMGVAADWVCFPADCMCSTADCMRFAADRMGFAANCMRFVRDCMRFAATDEGFRPSLRRTMVERALHLSPETKPQQTMLIRFVASVCGKTARIAQHFSAGFACRKRPKSRQGRQNRFFRPFRDFDSFQCDDPSAEALGYFLRRFDNQPDQQTTNHAFSAQLGFAEPPLGFCRDVDQRAAALSDHREAGAGDDAQFVNYWGYNFALVSDGEQYSKYYLQSVTVTKRE